MARVIFCALIVMGLRDMRSDLGLVGEPLPQPPFSRLTTSREREDGVGVAKNGEHSSSSSEDSAHCS
jgi:hypothetical protein